MEKRNVPKLRFKGFEDEWKEYKFKDITIKTGNKNKDNKQYDVYSISNKYGFIPQNEQFEDSRLKSLPKSDYRIVNKGEFAYNPARINVGSIGFWNEDKTVIVSSLYVCFKLINDMQPMFFMDYFNGYNFNKDVLRNVEGGVRDYLFYENFSNIKVKLPSIKEQEKIANFLSNVDKIIEEQEGKVKDLELYKKGMMQKIFKQEIRFKDDNGQDYPEWEDKKIKEIFNITRGQVIAKTSISPIKIDRLIYPVYSSQTSNYGILGYDSSYDFDGDFLTWTTDGANAGKVFKRNGKFRCTNVCGLLVEKDITKGFANKCIKEILEKETPKHVSYVGNPKLMNGIMGDIKINIPCLAEQTKIANFLSNIDKIIEEENKKLEDLRQWKKGLLQQMFV